MAVTFMLRVTHQWSMFLHFTYTFEHFLIIDSSRFCHNVFICLKQKWTLLLTASGDLASGKKRFLNVRPIS